MSPLPETDVRTGYNRWAETYDDDDNPLTLLEEPIVRRLVGDPAGRKIADIGCGTGRHTVPLANGGGHVTGVDFSSGMLSVLRAKRSAGSIEVIEHDLSEPLPLPTDQFDTVLCCLVLEHVEPLEATISELGRICRPGGHVIISDLHPHMVRQGLHARFRDHETGVKVQMRGAAHSISRYVMAGASAGLRIDHADEHTIDERTAAVSKSAAKYVGLPFLLTLRFVA